MSSAAPSLPEKSELERLVRIRAIPAEPVRIDASETERAALSKRFGLSVVESLRAEARLHPKGQSVRATGELEAKIVQRCAISNEDFPVQITEEFDFRFVPQQEREYDPEEEIELDAQDCDEIEYEGEAFDLGEAVAQTLGLAIDPFATGPDAEAARKEAGIVDEVATGPFAALAALKTGG
ncbi:YceD family protein [Qipengyuania atrilutea]|uniref:DUF177 domain-containing protein n=1 Tax=Qipengyuania atrilutea TaxID=2744473 RepID=A0A850H5A5_9SPHN|nr:DUF177 domain-containing protein [Actirhodobacter atriluteus]NVD45352.1 DUF177 domain-containing protein [Actirhodobacter atriluteus]